MWLGITSYVLLLLILFAVAGVFFKPLLNSSSVFIITAYMQCARLALILLTFAVLAAFLFAYMLVDVQLSQLGAAPHGAIDLSYLIRYTEINSMLFDLTLSSTPKFFFPFFFIFLFVTMLSIYFCLAYSAHEAFAFIGYCVLILIAGFVLLFTDSFVIFFLAYECLLVPSFLILYKFAKTRRCIEAAYLMFFWTQFGALFLIFAFVYLVSVTHVHRFSALELYGFSQFEVNFIFLLLFIGFGVKIPI
jgi:NADH:ubiquinone oxidoreductase subunit 4 (subunit M)